MVRRNNSAGVGAARMLMLLQHFEDSVNVANGSKPKQRFEAQAACRVPGAHSSYVLRNPKTYT